MVAKDAKNTHGGFYVGKNIYETIHFSGNIVYKISGKENQVGFLLHQLADTFFYG